MRNDLSAVKDLFNAEAAKNVADVEEIIKDEHQEEVIEEEVIEEEVIEEEVPDEEGAIDASDDETYTMKSLAEAIDLGQEELYGVMVPLRDGDPISIGEMKNQHQDLVRDKAKSEERIKELEQNQGQVSGQQQVSQAELQAHVELARVQDEFNNTDWTDLDEFDAGKSALLRQQLNDRYNRAQGVIQQASQIKAQERTVNTQKQYGILLDIIPEWKDDDKRKAEMGIINTAMLDAGYSQEIINLTEDPIAFKLARELVLLRAEVAKGADMVKRVKKAPRPLNAKKVAPATAKETITKKVTKARQTGNKHDAFDAVKAMMNNAYSKT